VSAKRSNHQITSSSNRRPPLSSFALHIVAEFAPRSALAMNPLLRRRGLANTVKIESINQMDNPLN
jgi:hypothetical protein